MKLHSGKKKWLIALLLVAGIGTSVALYASHNQTPSHIAPPALSLERSATMREKPYTHKFSPVDLIKVGDTILACDHVFIYALAENGLLKILPVVDNSAKDLKSVLRRRGISTVYPSAMHYSEETGLLYVADHGNQKILIGKLMPEGFVVSDSISSDESPNPEGIYADAEHIFIADYTASHIFIYTHDKHFVKKIPFSLAYGIVAHGDYMYVCGMGGPSLARINWRTEETIANSDLNYVTDLQIVGDKLVAIDANAGILQYFDLNLTPLSRVAYKTGPGPDELLRPYGFYVDEETIYIADTFKYRVLKTNENQIETIWTINTPVAWGKSDGNVKRADGYIYSLDAPEKDVLAKFLGVKASSIDISFQRIRIKERKKTTRTAYIPNDETSHPLGIIWVKYDEQNQRLYFGCPASLFVYYIELKTGECYTVKYPVNLLLFKPQSQTALNALGEFLQQLPRKEARPIVINE